MTSQLFSNPHKRLNILTGEWVLVSPQRTNRPWQGKTEAKNPKKAVRYDPSCYLCPTNTRATGAVNENYKHTFVFKNDYPALLEDTQATNFTRGLLQAQGEPGICKVICFSPDHSVTLPDMSIPDLVRVVTTWQEEFEALSKLPFINYIQIFENKGDIMGCSNPHPHGQIWAQHAVPTEIIKKTLNQKNYFDKANCSLLKTYLEEEIAEQSRLVCENEHFVTVVPFWAVWPFETMIIPKRQMATIPEMTETEKSAFAEIIKTLTQKYDAIFEVSFPYSSGIHQAPCDGKKYPEWHWHMSFYPPLLRSATIKKFMVGYEMFSMPQRDITPELVAERLRSL